MSEHGVARANELGPGDRLVVELEGREIGVFNLDGEYHAYLNWCAHQGGPLCEGNVTGRVDAAFDRESLTTEFEWVDEDATLVCPWHDWEYSLRTGECISDDNYQLPSYPVRVEAGEIVVTIE